MAGNRSPKVMAKALSTGFHRAMLVGLSVMGQRHHDVMEVVSGAPVTEVALRDGGIPASGARSARPG